MFYLLLIGALVTAATTHGTLAWSMVYGLIIFMIYGWISSSGIMRQLKISLDLPQTSLFSGERATAKLCIANPTKIPLLWLYIRQDLPSNIEVSGDMSTSNVITLGGLEERIFEFELGSLKRGVYTFGPLVMETGDVLGLSKTRQELPHNRSLVVYPIIHDLSHLRTPSRLPFGSPRSPKVLTDDPSWMRGVRDYQPGDPLSRIHWKATARLNFLQTKELEPAVTLNSAVVLDLDANAYPPRYFDPLVELSVETAASILSELLSRRCSCRLSSNIRNMPVLEGRGPLDMPEILGFLAAVNAQSGLPLNKTIGDSSSTVGMGGIVYIVTPHIEDSVVEAAYKLVGLGRSPVFIHVCPRDRIQSRMAALNRTSIQYIRAQRGLAEGSLELIVPSK